MSVASSAPEASRIAPSHCSRWRRNVGRLLQTLIRGQMALPQPLRVLFHPVSFVAEAMILGLLRPADIEQMVSDAYENAPEFYDPRHYRVSFEERILPTLSEMMPSGRLLDAFCGQGREAKLFAREGYRVTAIDRISWMIEKGKHYAEESGFDARFIAADFQIFRADTPFDVVYTSCWMYSTVQGRDARMKFLQRCIQLCDVNGVIIVSYVAQRHGRAIAWIRFLIARTTAALSGGNRQSEFGERTYGGLFWHHLTDETVSQEIERAGLAVVATVPGERAEPTFRILQRAVREDSCP